MGKDKYENISVEEQRKADAWFESFIDNTKDLGISFDNPLSLGLIKAVNDYDFAEFERLRDSDTIDENVKAVEMSASVASMPFMKEDERPYKGDNFIEHLYKNMRDPRGFSPEERYELYDLAKNGKLIIESTKSGSGNRVNFRQILVNEDGGAKITKSPGAFPFGNYNNRSKVDPNTDFTDAELHIINDCGYTADEFRKNYNILTDFGQILHHSEMGIPMLVQDMSDIKRSDPDYTDEDFRGYFESVKWVSMEQKILNKAYHNPEWTKTAESRKKFNDIAGAYGMNGIAQTSAEKKLIQKYAIFGSEVIDLDRDTKKILKIKPEQDIPSGRIKSGAGQDFQDLVTLEGYNKFAQYCRNEASELKIGGASTYYTLNDMGFQDCAPFNEYVKEFESIYQDLKKTNSIFSDDTEEYTNLMNGMKALSKDFAGHGKKQEQLSYNNIAQKIKNVAQLAERYQETHRTSELKPRNIKRLSAMIKLERLAEAAKNKDPEPRKPMEQVLEKVVLGDLEGKFATDIADFKQLAKDSLLSYDIFKSYSKTIETDPIFQRMTHHKDGSSFDREVLKALSRLSPSKSFDAYTTVGKHVTGKEFNKLTQAFDIRKETLLQRENDAPVVK